MRQICGQCREAIPTPPAVARAYGIRSPQIYQGKGCKACRDTGYAGRVGIFELLEVDELGFDEVDRKILVTLIEQYGGGPAGIQAIAAAVGEDRGTLEDLYEPFLIQEGFLQRTPRGRIATSRAYQHLGLTPPAGTSGTLF